jgi:hypothetical protein
MSEETKGAEELQEVQIDDAAAEQAFGEDAMKADEQVSRRMGDEVDEGKDEGAEGEQGGKPAEKAAKGKETPAEGEGEGEEEGKAKEEGGKPDAKKAKEEAEAVAKAQKEAEDRALLAEQAEKERKAREEAAKAGAGKPMDIADLSKSVRERIKGLKIEGYDNFEAFEKEYGASLTDAITAISAQIAQEMVAPILQQQAARERAAAHDKFIGQLAEMGHDDVAAIEASDGFWGWLDKPENANLKYLVERADVKGTDMVLRAYKAENGMPVKGKVAEGAPAGSGKSEREKLVEKQREAQKKADAIHKNTGRRSVTPPAKEGDEDITDEESAQKEFDAAVEQQERRSRGQSIR